MAVSNTNGHGVSSMAGHHNQQVVPANIQFPDHPGNISSGSGKTANDSMGAYSTPGMGKKKPFPPAVK